MKKLEMAKETYDEIIIETKQKAKQERVKEIILLLSAFDNKFDEVIIMLKNTYDLKWRGQGVSDG